MWRSFWRSIDRFSVQHFKYLVNELQEIKVVNMMNREFVVELLKSIVELVTYSDQHDPSIFESFMEYQILAEFLRILKISRNSIIEAPLLHYLSIMIQNLASEHAIYYCFSNDYINNIILHQYKFDGGDLVPYYVSFLRTVSGKLNRDTLCLLVKVQEDTVVSFPLYNEALKFACHEEKMIQTAVRAVILNIYNVSDEMVYKFITTPPVSEYFSDLVLNLRGKCLHLDALVHATKDASTHEMRKKLLLESDKFVDDLYYCKDIILVGESCLGRLMIRNLLSLLVLPILLPLLQISETEIQISAITALYVVCRLLQVVDSKELVNSVAFIILFPHLVLSRRGPIERERTGDTSPSSFDDYLSEMEKLSSSSSESEAAEDNNKNPLFRHLSQYFSSSFQCVSYVMDDIKRQRAGILSLIFSESQNLLLASMMLLLVLSESKELDSLFSSMLGLPLKKTGGTQMMASEMSLSQMVEAPIIACHMPQILHGLLKIITSQPPCSVIAQWNAGWILQKLLSCQEKNLTDHELDLFNVSYERSCERLHKEINNFWFDFIPVTLKNEWENCRKALTESSELKDPFFTLGLSSQNHTPDEDMTSSLAWERMVNVVKVFLLHNQLKAFISKGVPLENPLPHLENSSMSLSRRVDASPTTSGTNLHLGTRVPCKIAFSKSGVQEIYMVPVVNGISGKLLLTEELPLYTHQRVVIAIAPLAGLNVSP
uniref:FPL domain-containing protein n=1 Tax=Nelumbo nucifera TaxID=4432 RepID=A0A822ZY08_NELNU|nr:TPA_asm: hypothetical protein HUJ06_018348 [Nelumbo nucifera]